MAVKRAASDSWAPLPVGFAASGSCVIDWLIDWHGLLADMGC